MRPRKISYWTVTNQPTIKSFAIQFPSQRNKIKTSHELPRLIRQHRLPRIRNVFPTTSPGGCKTKSRAKVSSAGPMEPGQGCGLSDGFLLLKKWGINDGFGHKKNHAHYHGNAHTMVYLWFELFLVKITQVWACMRQLGLKWIEILVGGLEHGFFFHSVGNVIIPTDELIFFWGVGQPPTSLFLKQRFSMI